MADQRSDAAVAEAALIASLEQRAAERSAERAQDDRAAAQALLPLSALRRAALPAFVAQQERRARPRGRAISLSALPTAVAYAEPRRVHEVPVAGVARSGFAIDLPGRIGWHLQLGRPAAVCGWFALRSSTWDRFLEPADLVVRLLDGTGTPVVERGLVIHPAARPSQRRWVPWRVELPSVGAALLELSVGEGVTNRDYGWALIGEPVLDVVGVKAPPLPRRRSRVPRKHPTIALLMPVHDPPLHLLERTVASVAAQRSQHWELCISDDGSRDPEVRAYLEATAAADPRVRLTRSAEARGISAATNAALGLTQAPYVATLDHDDLLHPDAIGRVGQAIVASPAADVLYTDNDLVAGRPGDIDRSFSAALKPGWSPDLMRSVMYTLHLGVYRRSLVEQIGGWRTQFDGAQDHDLVLRLSEATDRIVHVPGVLAHWRAHGGSAALGAGAKPLAFERGRAAVEAHLERVGMAGRAEALPWPGRYRIRLERSSDVTVVLPAGADDEVVECWRGMVRPGDVVIVRSGGPPSSWSSLASELATPLALLVEQACVPDGREALDELVGHVEAGAGAAGGVVVDVAGRVVAGGVAFPRGTPVDLHVGADLNADDRHPSLTMVSNRLAVRGVVALRTRALSRSTRGGLAGLTAALADAGERVVWSPHARFTADERATRALRTIDLAQLVALDRGARPDPFWNPLRSAGFSDESYDDALHEGQP